MQEATAISGPAAAMLAALYREIASATEIPALAILLRRRAEQLEKQDRDPSRETVLP